MSRLPRMLISLALLLVLALPALAEESPGTRPDAARAQGRALLLAYRQGNTGTLWRAFDAGMARAMGSQEQFEATVASIAKQTGEYQGLISEELPRIQGMQAYLVHAKFANWPQGGTITFVFDDQGEISGFWVRPEQGEYPSTHGQDSTRTPLQLPFRGEWTVVWGGRTLAQNYHAITRDQRFAYDFVMVRDSSTHRGEGKSNADYYCWGEPILVPYPARVVWVEGNVGDNSPGESNPNKAFGNAVILDFMNGEYGVFAHLGFRTVRVSRGQVVSAGDTLGLAGNSGNSTEPHLHFHLQDSPRQFDAEGLPARFDQVVVDDTLRARAEPVRGQRIRRK